MRPGPHYSRPGLSSSGRGEGGTNARRCSHSLRKRQSRTQIKMNKNAKLSYFRSQNEVFRVIKRLCGGRVLEVSETTGWFDNVPVYRYNLQTARTGYGALTTTELLSKQFESSPNVAAKFHSSMVGTSHCNIALPLLKFFVISVDFVRSDVFHKREKGKHRSIP
jgi:hypothetical protein